MAISIKEPCHEDWTKMTPTQKGAFCQACALEVIDFTDKSPYEIKSMLAKEFATTTRTCSRITNFQLDQINDDFFKWKNDTDAFRAVWIFSLIAVFGLSLFSCQNTLSKELVGQLNIETTEMLSNIDSTGYRSTQADSMDLALDKNDSSSANIFSKANLLITEYPWELEVITTAGVTPFYPMFYDSNTWNVCSITLGTYLLGSIAMPTDEKEEVKEFLAEVPLPFISSPFSPITKDITPIERTPRPIHPTTPRIEATNDSAGKKFDSFIYPNPINADSLLYLDAFEAMNMDIEIFRKGDPHPLHFGFSTFSYGRHSMDLKLYDLAKGDYQLRLKSINQVSELDFVVRP